MWEEKPIGYYTVLLLEYVGCTENGGGGGNLFEEL